MAFDFEVRAPKRDFADQTVGARAVEQDRSGFQNILTLTVSLVPIRIPFLFEGLLGHRLQIRTQGFELTREQNGNTISLVKMRE